jgi:branched-chain amino acid transport system substrate-binding protein
MRHIGLLALITLLPLALPSIATPQTGKPPVKIGVVTTLTGVFAQLGKEALDGFRLYLDEINSRVAGRAIELIVEDDEVKPDVGLTKMRKLVERDQVHMVTGIVSSGVAYAVGEYIKGKKVPLIISADAGAGELTTPGPRLNPYVFRVTPSIPVNANVAANWAYKHGWRKVAIIASDYASGVENAAGFAREFCGAGGQVVEEIYPPLGNPDFAPYIAKIPPDKVDGLVVVLAGSDALRFGTQYAEYGLHGKLPIMDIIGGMSIENHLVQFRDLGLGTFSVLHYAMELDTPINRRFVNAFRAKYGRLPDGDNAADGYDGARAIVEALKAINGNVEDREAFMSALKKVKFDSPRKVATPLRLDEFGQAILDFHIRKVEKREGRYVNTVIDTYKDTSQFWKWSPEELTKMPAYRALKNKLSDCARVLGKQ